MATKDPTRSLMPVRAVPLLLVALGVVAQGCGGLHRIECAPRPNPSLTTRRTAEKEVREWIHKRQDTLSIVNLDPSLWYSPWEGFQEMVDTLETLNRRDTLYYAFRTTVRTTRIYRRYGEFVSQRGDYGRICFEFSTCGHLTEVKAWDKHGDRYIHQRFDH